ncbi:hypothetical protein FD755_017152 [Muntiacus reevesi]|uniref:Peptidase S1 domain-containing protein n=1 Tax=Muntiacus reevesi TaxID=9886 RepID=A0A5N3X9V9_MUNRE|nr:hypothetical protein FD755_017152 [Muntiacus reevesi]
MNSEQPESQKDPDEKRKTSSEQCFSKVSEDQQDNSNTSQMKMDAKTSSESIDNTQAEGPRDQAVSPEKTIYVTLDINIKQNNGRNHRLTCNDGGASGRTSTLSGFWDTAQKELTDSYTLECLSGVSLRTATRVFGRFDNTSAVCVNVYIHAVGKTRKALLKRRQLHKNGYRLGVHAFKGESMRRLSQLADDLEGKLFQTEVKKKKKKKTMKAGAPATGNSQVEVEKATDARAPAARNSESQEIKPCVLKQSWQTNTLVRKEKVIKLEKTFENNLDKTQGEILFEVPKTDFGKLTGNRARTEVHTLLSGLGGSVGHLPRHSGKSVGSATCLVLKGLYISTCRHVTYWTVGEDIESRECARTLGRCVKVTFAYEKAEDENKHCFSIERWFETPDVKLDYPVLKLKRNGQQVPERQQTGVGHPDGEVKYTHACAVIPQDQREETYLEHIRARAADRRGACAQYIHMHTQRSFQETVPQPDVVTHNTAFYFGSSGFPVFDSEGSLVAKHTAGFAFKYPQGISSIIEFSCTLKSIIYAIKKKT